MNEILISLKPNWIKEIFYNKKILELRKNYPKCNLPIKAYIYCTKNGEEIKINNKRYNGNIIGEFNIKKIFKFDIINDELYADNKKTTWEKLENYSKVNREEIKKYFGNTGYGWQIINPILYDNIKVPEEILGINFDKRLLMSWTLLK